MSPRVPTPYKEVGHRISDLRREVGRRHGAPFRQRDLARRLDVAEGTVTAWETGRQRPEGENLLALARLLTDELEREITAEFITHGTETAGAASDARTQAATVFRDFDQVARMLGGVGEPGQATARKLAAIEGLERAAVALGWELPDWWFGLRAQVERGEI